MTYSIIARDPRTGELGGAVQSCFFAAGRTVRAEAGVGVIVSQAIADPGHHELGFELLRQGAPARDALRAIVEGDDGRDVRQIAIVDASGRRAAHTGAKCVAEAGHALGEGFSVQANMMERATVVAAMTEAFASAEGDLDDRLLSALLAAQAEGGDLRGQQSAGMVIVGGERSDRRGAGSIIDIRVDDHQAPLDELGRLVERARGYRVLARALDRIDELDLDEALHDASEAAQRLPHAVDPAVVCVGLLLVRGEHDAARAAITSFAGDRERLVLAVRRFAATGLLPVDPSVVETVVERALDE